MNGIGFAAVRDLNAWLRYENEGRCRHGRIRWPATSRGSTPRSSSQPGRMLNDFRNLGFNQAENGKNVFDGMMQWIAAGDGINMNYRFSQPGRTERNRQDHLYRRGRVPVRQRSTRPIRSPARPQAATTRCTTDEHLPAGDGDLLGQRVLGEGGVAAAHRPDGQGGPAGLIR